MTSNTKLAAPPLSSQDSKLTSLEAVWRLATDAFEAAHGCGFQESVFDPIARRIEDAEKRIAITPAGSIEGVAVKLRIILRYEMSDAEKRHWFAMLQSAVADLEALAAQDEEQR